MATICVFCASSSRVANAHLQLARTVGTRLAQRGHTLITGGSVSMMGEVTSGARAAGAKTIGIVPRELVELEMPEPAMDEVVVTDSWRERKAEMDRRADAFLALPGGLGTLEELLEVWTAKALGVHDKPVVVLDPTGVYDSLFRQVDQLRKGGFVREDRAGAITVVRTVEEALEALTPAAQAAAGAPAGRARAMS
ncbi:MAG: TIGR00730 family Rossman fold protein [Mycobacteriales bacterium]